VHVLADVIAFGLFSSSLLSIGAVGFSLQFGVTNVLNLAYGAIMTSALYIYYVVIQVHAPLVLSVVCATAFGAVFSWLFNLVIVTPYVRRGTSLFAMAMVTIAVGLIIQFSLEAIQGPVILSLPTSNSTEFHFVGVTMSLTQVLIIAVAIGVMVAVQTLLRCTRLGLGMRATATDPALSRACGTSTRRVRAIAWLLSGALCGLCGTLLGINQGAFNSATGNEFFIVIVAAAIVGGIGKPTGAMLGALIIGVVTEAAAAVISPSYKDVVAFAVLVVVLLLRPQGILAEFAAERELAV
jgi:branched-subunit amino acid ABC-type transport system permease component